MRAQLLLLSAACTGHALLMGKQADIGSEMISGDASLPAMMDAVLRVRDHYTEESNQGLGNAARVAIGNFMADHTAESEQMLRVARKVQTEVSSGTKKKAASAMSLVGQRLKSEPSSSSLKRMAEVAHAAMADANITDSLEMFSEFVAKAGAGGKYDASLAGFSLPGTYNGWKVDVYVVNTTHSGEKAMRCISARFSVNDKDSMQPGYLFAGATSTEALNAAHNKPFVWALQASPALYGKDWAALNLLSAEATFSTIEEQTNRFSGMDRFKFAICLEGENDCSQQSGAPIANVEFPYCIQ